MAIVAVSAWFRLIRLGDSAFRSDEIEFLKICRQPISGIQVWTRWFQIMGRSSQFPFAMAWTKGFLNSLRLPVSDFTVRLPAALWGIAAVAASYLGGQAAGGRVFGLLVAMAMALNPLHLQVSREAYFYPPLHLGATLLTWSAIWAVRHRHLSCSFPVRYYLLTGLGLFLAAYSHLSGWWLTLVVAAVTFSVAAFRALGKPRPKRDLAVHLIAYGVVGLPLLFLPWGVPYFWDELHRPEIKAYTAAVFSGVAPRPLPAMAWEAASALGWGARGARTILMVTGLMSILTLGILHPRQKLRFWALGWITGGGFLLFYAGHKLSATPFNVRYVGFLLCPYLILLLGGLWSISALPGLRRWRYRRWIAWSLVVVALAAWVRPAWLCTRIRGKGKPYREIVAQIDAAVPRGTLVLVDRWFEPWNELAVHRSTNVFFTFTVPNEPMEVCREVNWWQTAKDFFERFPDAAYLEVCNSYWTNEARWPWLEQQFAHHLSLDDPATRELARLGLNYREYQVVHFHWNTLDDVLAKARDQGRTALALFGPGWGYTKLWQQVRGDFRDWRVLTDQAELHLYNLTDRPLSAQVLLRGSAVNGAKGIRASTGAWHTFPQGQIQEWTLDGVPLVPGKNVVELSDPHIVRRPTALLVSDVLVRASDLSERP